MDDALNDDTFGDVSIGGDWEQNQEQLAKMHEEFLADQSKAGGGGFFGDLGDTNDFLLEPDSLESLESKSLEPEAPPRPPLQVEDDAPLEMDAGLRHMLDETSPRQPKAKVPPLATSGLRVAGLPSSLDALGARQLLSHFGALGSFELQRGATTSTALLSYQDPAVSQTAYQSLQGIPLGGR